MKLKKCIPLIILVLLIINSYGQISNYTYNLNICKDKDSFLVELMNINLTGVDSIYNFVAYAPGMHIPLNYGRLVEDFKAFDSNGIEVITMKYQINQYQLLNPEAIKRIQYSINPSFDAVLKSGKAISPMAGTGILDNLIFFNPYGIFGYFNNYKDCPVKLTVQYPDNFRIGTTAVHKNDSFFFNSIYNFFDTPFMFSKKLSFAEEQLDDMTIKAFVYSSNDSVKAEKVIKTTKSITEAGFNFIGFSPVHEYAFIMFFLDDLEQEKISGFNGGGALEHSHSSVYAFPERPIYLNYLDNLFAHEFMHILSPLHLHSNILANFDYSKPLVADKHIWLYEGVTVWASYLMRVHKGLITPEGYLEILSKLKRNSNNYDSDYSLVRISQEWNRDKGHKQYANVYNKGVLTASMLNLRLLSLSKGKYDLKQLYLNLIDTYGTQNAFDNDSLFSIIVNKTYPEIESFIENYIENSKELSFSDLFQEVGVEYIESDFSRNVYGDVGISTRVSEGQIIIDKILKNYISDNFKIGDIIISINDLKIEVNNYKQILKKINNSNKYTITIRRNNEIITYKEVNPSCFIIDKERVKGNKVYEKWVTGK